jgi:manganese-dependent inorganic pyrophosphatase
VLERFGLPFPNIVESLAATVSDLEFKKPIAIHERDSVQALSLLMRETGVRALPVVDDSGRVTGIVGLKDIARHYMDSVGFSDLMRLRSARILIKTPMAVSSAIEENRVPDLENFYCRDAERHHLNRVHLGDVVIIGDQHDIQLDLIRSGCSALIVTDGMPLGNDVLAA